jgi:hypothetical protein
MPSDAKILQKFQNIVTGCPESGIVLGMCLDMLLNKELLAQVSIGLWLDL